MKNLLIISVFFILSIEGKAQSTFSQTQGNTINFEITSQEARMPWWILNLDLVQIDMGLKNIDGASFNVGFRGYVSPLPNFGFDYKYNRSWLTGSFKGFNSDLEIGAFYGLSNKIKRKNTKIILDYKIDKNYDGPQTTETISMKYFKTPADRRIIRGIRSGLITKSGPLGINDLEGIISSDITLKSNGIYIGLVQKTLINVFANVEKWGEQYHSMGRDFAVDILIYPNNRLVINNLEGTMLSADEIKNKLDAGNIGWRLVYDMYQIEKKSRTGKSFGSTFRFELGSKPYQGIYFAGSWGMTLIKAKKRPF